jgi:hypothetical protein
MGCAPLGKTRGKKLQRKFPIKYHRTLLRVEVVVLVEVDSPRSTLIINVIP